MAGSPRAGGPHAGAKAKSQTVPRSSVLPPTTLEGTPPVSVVAADRQLTYLGIGSLRCESCELMAPVSTTVICGIHDEIVCRPCIRWLSVGGGPEGVARTTVPTCDACYQDVRSDRSSQSSDQDADTNLELTNSFSGDGVNHTDMIEASAGSTGMAPASSHQLPAIPLSHRDASNNLNVEAEIEFFVRHPEGRFLLKISMSSTASVDLLWGKIAAQLSFLHGVNFLECWMSDATLWKEERDVSERGRSISDHNIRAGDMLDMKF